jgi:N,N'-diacetyllegionaminate synthase
MQTTIIAEAGVNHNGNIETAKKLIDAAAAAGADYVKFQTFKADRLAGKSARRASYQTKNIGDNDDSQYAMLKKLELSEEMHIELMDYCQQKGIKFLSTGFDEDSVDFLDKLNLDLFKIPSGEISNKPLLQHIASKGKPVIMSTGMANMTEINAAMHVLLNNGLNQEQITVLHCNTEYPTPMEDVNLKAMLSEQKKINVARKSIVAGCRINKDEIFSSENLTVKRPGNGLSPMMWDDVVGKEAKRDFEEDELIEL